MISTRLRDIENIDLAISTFSSQFLRGLHDFEDVIDNHIGEIEQQRRNYSLKIMSPLICSIPQQDRIDLISEELKKIVTSFEHMELENYGPTTGTTSSPLQPRNLHYPVPDDSDFVGLNDKVDEVVKLLCDGEMPNTIAVTGAPGSGKTFLTKTVYNATEVKRHFDGLAWGNFSEDFESREFLIDILTQLTWDWEFSDENLSYEELKLKLLNFSSNKRCLIVVDDFPTLEYFNRLFDVCRLSSKGTWLILIVFMQDEEFASLEVKPCFCHLIRLRSLTDKESWTLFCKKSPIAEETTRFKENILTNCGGSPRTILIMGGLLSTTKRPIFIERKIQVDFVFVLSLCYQGLSSQMKFCFLYFRLFPRAFEIPVRSDKSEIRWKPQNMSYANYTWDVFSRTAEVLGHSHDHNKIYRYGLHDLSDIRRLTKYAANGIDPKFYDRLQYLRSYASFNTESSGKFLDALVTLRGFGLLVVLDLENVYKPAMLSETLGKLLLLKHLGLRRTFLDSLPRSVGNLPYLETLDVKHTNVTSLPSSIWKAKKLQHLYLNENNFDMPFKKTYIGSDSEIILQTLSGLFIGNKNVVKSYLYSLHHLRKLKLTFYSKSVEGIASWISELKALRSLKLRSIDEFDRPATLELGSLETHHELLELYLVGPLTRSIESLCSPNLRVLTLSASKFRQDPMPILGKLRHLNCLRLFRNSFLGKDMTCCAGEFPQLRVLKLWMLENLEKWTVMEGTMPLLGELEIRLCPKLNQPVKLPLTLKDVVLINMPDGFGEYVERILVNSFVKKITLPFAALPVRLIVLLLLFFGISQLT
ncbi:hypothetical protein SO802_004891 [Lithocarpus litseifolius]|uniref:NB-ARC domain-containing protein n=1 Tax=Lithocarpus litseifolius TaxID=425828 RepID=A0AAW2DGL9_9ROSI